MTTKRTPIPDIFAPTGVPALPDPGPSRGLMQTMPVEPFAQPPPAVPTPASESAQRYREQFDEAAGKPPRRAPGSSRPRSTLVYLEDGHMLFLRNCKIKAIETDADVSVSAIVRHALDLLMADHTPGSVVLQVRTR
jgi:hypothetical protein